MQIVEPLQSLQARPTRLSWSSLMSTPVSVTFPSFLPGVIYCSLVFVLCTFDTFSRLLPLTHFFGHCVMCRSKLCQYNAKLIYICCALNFMSHIYGVESPIDTTRARTVWDSHMSTIKWGSLTFTQSSQVCCHGIYCHKSVKQK